MQFKISFPIELKCQFSKCNRVIIKKIGNCLPISGSDVKIQLDVDGKPEKLIFKCKFCQKDNEYSLTKSSH